MNVAKKLSVSTLWSRLAKNAELCLALKRTMCVWRVAGNKAEAANYNFNLFGARAGTLEVGSEVGGYIQPHGYMTRWVCNHDKRPCRPSNRIKIRERKCSQPKVVLAF